ncbi:hypothetical protein [Nonomuraea deserti]|uniref:hypothetical protein n=1 Tax=Nonomuraea deserti TaxID=1848322 RepID=UPI001404ED34|nr:hypothetical protein [Nonomuraea deserti]
MLGREVALSVNVLDGDLDKIRLTLDTHFYGTLAMIRAFAPVLDANGGEAGKIEILADGSGAAAKASLFGGPRPFVLETSSAG